MICFIIQKPMSISKNAKLNKHLVTGSRRSIVGGSVLHSDSGGFALEEQTEVYVFDISTF